MPQSDPSNPPSQPPMETEPTKVGERAKGAGGIPAIVETTRHTVGRMGVGRTFRTLSRLNQKGGFDCPSCAWPDPDGHRAATEFCENGAKAVASEATTARITPEFFAQHSIADLAAQSDLWLDRQGRLTRPMVRRANSDHYEPIAWDDAFALIAETLNSLDSPDEATFYTSGRTSNEAAFIYQLFVRQFGTNNLPDCSNMCHESSGTGLTESIGIGKGTVKLEDFDHADAIFIIGQNPGTNHPRMLTALQRASRNGCTIVSVNPLPEAGMARFKHPQEVLHLLGPGTPIAKLFLPVRINGDVALLKGIMKEMLQQDDQTGGAVFEHEFIRDETEGFDAFTADLRNESWDTITEQSGVQRDLIQQAAKVAMQSQRMICCWAMGITQHENGVANVQTIVNFLLLRANFGRSGAGACPVRGHSNVQGDRTMGIWEKMPAAFLDRLGSEFNFTPPQHEGCDVVQSMRAMHDGRVKVFVGMGGNFLAATPDTQYTAEALQKCRLTVQVSTKLNRGHLVTGETALILPCLGRTERDEQGSGGQFVSVENSMGVVHSSHGSLEPASEHLLSEPAIICRLAQAVLGERTTVNWQSLADDYDRIRDHIANVIPGCEDYNARVRQPGGFYLPNGPREGTFTTDSGKAKFIAHPIPRHDLAPGQLLLMTMRSHDQFNTTIYGEDDRYRGIRGGRRVIFLNPDDMAQRDLKQGDAVDITSHYENETRRAERFMVVPYSIPRRSAAAYFPEANVLVPASHTAKRSNQPASKSVVITVSRTA